ncbi:MAG TPA: hypothetical protein VGB25_10515 [Candidatus Binatia bacterium]
MSNKENMTIRVTCPCCGSSLTIDATLGAVLEHKEPTRPPPLAHLKDASKMLKEEANRREEKYQNLAEAEKSKGKVLERKFQDLLKKAKEEPLTKPIRDIDLD